MRKDRDSLKPFIVELAIYAVLVVGYFFLVLTFLNSWLKELFDDNKTYYAIVALGLIVAQGIALDFVTSGLLRLIKLKIR